MSLRLRLIISSFLSPARELRAPAVRDESCLLSRRWRAGGVGGFSTAEEGVAGAIVLDTRGCAAAACSITPAIDFRRRLVVLVRAGALTGPSDASLTAKDQAAEAATLEGTLDSTPRTRTEFAPRT